MARKRMGMWDHVDNYRLHLYETWYVDENGKESGWQKSLDRCNCPKPVKGGEER